MCSWSAEGMRTAAGSRGSSPLAWSSPARDPRRSPSGTLGETGVHCAVIRTLGGRLHPITNVHCDYLLCEYLAGDAANVDVVENVSVVWTDKMNLTRFIPADLIFPPILEALEIPGDPVNS
jgi:hypothetical protein